MIESYNAHPNPLDACGFTARQYLSGAAWSSLVRDLEDEQAEFLSRESSFRSDEYRWPRDPLHTWSRIWEYPYVLHNLRRIVDASGTRTLAVMDFGSGVTFFPFLVAKLGCDVTCIDTDPVCVHDLAAAASVFAAPGAHIHPVLSGGQKLPVASSSMDIVYTISVVEHIVDFARTIDELARVTKEGGYLVLTLDIDLRGGSELSAGAFEEFHTALRQYFEPALPSTVVHPLGCLTTANSIHRIARGGPLRIAKELAKALARRTWPVGDLRVAPLLTVYCGVYRRR